MTITCPSSLTLSNAQAVLRDFRVAFAQVAAVDKGWALDLGPLEHFDSSALAVLIDCRRQAQAAGQRLMIKDAPHALVELALVYGVTELIDVDPDSSP
ncbi:MAG: lipid asymmetry maintenance protein MlaB [Leptothrix ochracea]|uniref:STAS domain-containing protein n=1 Tax=Leptothrix ochracea TaxID=735331 RepID=UPI0034E298D4